MTSGQKTIFITGASSGIGKRCAEYFAARGWFVGLYDINESGVSALAESIGREKSVPGALNVADPESWQQALAGFAEKTGGRLDVLLNNAGILTTGALADTDLNRQMAMIDVNLKGCILGCHTAFPYLAKTAGSKVINMCSATGIYGQPNLATYSATKFAVRGLTEALDIEWEPHGIRVSDVIPAFVNTPMADVYGHLPSAKSAGIHVTPEMVADTVFRCATIKSYRAHWPVGKDAKQLMLATRLLPPSVVRRVLSKLTM